MEEAYMSVQEFCDRINISQSTCYRMIRNKQIKAIKFGRKWKIPYSVFKRIQEY